MKWSSVIKWFLIVTAVLGIGVYAELQQPVKIRENPAAVKANGLRLWLSAWALDHGGRFPADLHAFMNDRVLTDRYGIPPGYLEDVEVLEYHGARAGLNRDEPLLRLRMKTRPEWGCLLKASGKVSVARVNS
jgi:hypothetical protein